MNKALFLDRDGIINIDHGYVYQKENFEFTEGIFDVCAKAMNKGYLLIVITNQSGIGRGKYSETEFLDLTNWMKGKFSEKEIHIDDVYYCPHHPTKGLGNYLAQCSCRKPEPELILKAADKYDIDLEKSIFIGDKISDMKAASSAGIPNRILLSSDYGDEPEIKAHRINHISKIIPFLE